MRVVSFNFQRLISILASTTWSSCSHLASSHVLLVVLAPHRFKLNVRIGFWIFQSKTCAHAVVCCCPHQQGKLMAEQEFSLCSSSREEGENHTHTKFTLNLSHKQQLFSPYAWNLIFNYSPSPVKVNRFLHILRERLQGWHSWKLYGH